MWKEVARRARSTVHKAVPPLEVERAAVLDGAHLWLTVDVPYEGRVLALSAATGRSTTFSGPFLPGLRTVLLDFDELPGAEDDFDLFFESTGPGPRRPLREATSPDRPTQAPHSPDARWHHRVIAPEGVLVLQRRAVPPVRSVLHLSAVDDAIEVAWQGTADDEFVLIDGDGATMPVRVERLEDCRVRLTVSNFAETDLRTSAVVRHRDEVVPLTRAHNDLVRPNAAVVLPEAETDAGTLRLAWAQDASLRVIWKATR